ncbi:MAG: DUF1127 domain-containing protein [Paracoccaceae bacterium]|jgi:uncharacterized protein YjiS (DUF1127 family)|nr:DUF1127 domain-containing protein [Paracoccaceae bacterium]
MYAATAPHSALFTGLVSTRRPGILKAVTNMVQLRKERRALALLDPAALADIGISRQEAVSEAARPVWDAPNYWHK